ncbi:unnamed protein product [Lathyrus sativus]|nr:unnamed protein product [Lathyrus sativus]
MEILNLKQHSSLAKVIGTMVCIGGALTITLYKGMPLISDVFPNIEIGESGINISGKSDWIVGAFLLATGCFFLSVIYIVQYWIIKDYQEELLVTTICCSFTVILSIVAALIVEGNSKAWILRPDKKLVSIC